MSRRPIRRFSVREALDLFFQTDEDGIGVEPEIEEDVSEIEDNDPDFDPDHHETEQSTYGEEEAPEEEAPGEEAPVEDTPEEARGKLCISLDPLSRCTVVQMVVGHVGEEHPRPPGSNLLQITFLHSHQENTASCPAAPRTTISCLPPFVLRCCVSESEVQANTTAPETRGGETLQLISMCGG
ncbi:unnamed protein product [Pleuronectes platessa]|uniref:Uncharacterized protein n=1 Tax=Pleuronectes platessa TaxID=8262 RepID=A0A9N7U3T0_PLEPL|nr:unnamed protein product [Pleuronectes platessa]